MALQNLLHWRLDQEILGNAVPGFIETEMTISLDEKTVKEWRSSIPLRRGYSI